MDVPTTFLMVSQSASFARTGLSSVRTFVSDGAHVPSRSWERTGPGGKAFKMDYGLTGVSPNNSYRPEADTRRKPISVGLPVLHCDPRVVGDDVEELTECGQQDTETQAWTTVLSALSVRVAPDPWSERLDMQPRGVLPRSRGRVCATRSSAPGAVDCAVGPGQHSYRLDTSLPQVLGPTVGRVSQSVAVGAHWTPRGQQPRRVCISAGWC